MRLVQGVKYRAELDLPFYASNVVAKGRLEDAGFRDVVVYDVGSKTYAQGVWGGESADVELPSQVKHPVEVA